MKARILVVDDDPNVREFLQDLLRIADYETVTAATAAEVSERLSETPADLVVLDLFLPDGDGLQLLPEIKGRWPDTEVVVLTGHASFDAAVEATKRGAYHFLTKPIDPKSIILHVERALDHKRLSEEARSLRSALSAMNGETAPIFQSPAMQGILRTVERIAATDVPVLISGEIGTGKEVIAELIHGRSHRNRHPLLKVNCAALPSELISSELFGCVRGAFPGAVTDREGAFRRADGGTLVLDEIGGLPLDVQGALIQTLSQKQVSPIGSQSAHPVDCRLIAITIHSEKHLLQTGRLREDLFYRINGIGLHLPPLRERREDILPLANAFLKRYAAQAGAASSTFSADAVEALARNNWPGNVRQLQNAVQRAVLVAAGGLIQPRDLGLVPPRDSEGPEAGGLSLMEAMERNTIIQALQATGGNKLAAARRLGIGRQTLYNKIRQYSIRTP